MIPRSYPAFRRLLLDLDPGGTDALGMFPLYLKKTDDVLSSFFDLVAFLLAGDWQMSLKFRTVHLPPQRTITEEFP